MYIITFYSFKGGVGRTMALVNTGAELARRGRKVLLVDFDLEAPGLSTYELLAPKKEGHPGIVEFVTEYRNTHRAPLVTDFLYEAKKDKRIDKKGGKLWVMPAGRGDADYRRKLNALSWRDLYDHEEGFLLFEDTRLQWEAELKPDYVLIDARTGHTDIEGICTRQLADAVVVVFYPNEQNLAGLKQVVRSIRAEETSGLEKKITLHFVASNVPELDDEDRHLHRKLDLFRGGLEMKDLPIRVIHRHESFQMLEQPVFVFQRPRSRLAREYRRLVRALLVNNPADREGALLYLREARTGESPLLGRMNYLPKVKRWSEPHLKGLPHTRDYVNPYGYWWLEDMPTLNRITLNFWDDSDVLLEVATYHLDHSDWEAALRCLNRVVRLNPNFSRALYLRGVCRNHLNDPSGAGADLLGALRLRQEDKWMSGLWAYAFLELLDASLPAFIEALSLPRFRESCLERDREHFLLHHVALRLIQHRRWADCIHYLESDLPEVLRELTPAGKEEQSNSEYQFWYIFYSAIAHWGRSGTLRKDLCQQALACFLPEEAEGRSEEFDTTALQRLALLWWGLGNKDQALLLLDKALKCLEERGGTHFGEESVWTFREATPQEFVEDCEKMRRMIHGDPIRPAFLAPPS